MTTLASPVRPPEGSRARQPDASGFVERAGVLASANDLLPAASAVVEGLTPLRRGLTRLLGSRRLADLPLHVLDRLVTRLATVAA